jgi:RNA polymerase sigma factor (sigma-70 family)
MTQGLLARERRPAPAHSDPADAPDAELLRRFAHARDDAAFAALVRRHGPMVFGVCRRVLRDSHEAEEAFQVTFLVLVRKAGGLRQPGRLASWLYGVANRVARKSRVTAARRGKHERAAAEPSAGVPPAEVDSDLRAVLDEEMVALPEKYRAPLVLCYLEGLTNEAAAERLGWPAGSMSYRLARGRELLRKRLVRRGVCLALWPIFWQSLSESATAAPVPGPLLDATVERAGREKGRAPAYAGVGPTWLLLAVLLVAGFGTFAVAAIGPSHAAPPPGESSAVLPVCGCHPTPAP